MVWVCGLLLLLVVVSGAVSSDCLVWSEFEGTEFPSEGGKASPVCMEAACREQDRGPGFLLSANCRGPGLAALAGCDVWWRTVTEDVIPPVPELAAALPAYEKPRDENDDRGRSKDGGEKWGACLSKDGRVGLFGLTAGYAFGQCHLGDGDILDGGGFDLLQARRITSSREQCSKRLDPKERLRELLEAVTSDDQMLFEAATGKNFGELQEALLSADSACFRKSFLSASRFVAQEAFNDLGAHALRALMARRAFERRVRFYGNASHSSFVEKWLAEGILVLEYEDDENLYALLRQVAGEPDLPRPPYDWTPRNVKATEAWDPQFEPHLDSFAPVIKIWRFLPPLTTRHGPLTFVKGSQALTLDKLQWLHAYSKQPQALREPSFRLKGSDLAATQAPDFLIRCHAQAEPVLTLPATKKTTLVIADTSAIHFRSPADPGFVRHSLRIKGDNAGGIPRHNPFRWEQQ